MKNRNKFPSKGSLLAVIHTTAESNSSHGYLDSAQDAVSGILVSLSSEMPMTTGKVNIGKFVNALFANKITRWERDKERKRCGVMMKIGIDNLIIQHFLSPPPIHCMLRLSVPYYVC